MRALERTKQRTTKAAANKVDSKLAITCFTHTQTKTTTSSVVLLANQTRPRPVLLWHGLAALKEPLAGPVPAHAHTRFRKTYFLHPVEAEWDQKDVIYLVLRAKSIKHQRTLHI